VNFDLHGNEGPPGFLTNYSVTFWWDSIL